MWSFYTMKHSLALLSGFITIICMDCGSNTVSKDDICSHVALPVAAFIELLTNLSFREQPLLPVVDVFSVGWV